MPKFKEGQLIQINSEHFADVNRRAQLPNGKFNMAGGRPIDGELYSRLIRSVGKVCTTSRDSVLIDWGEYGLWVDAEFVLKVKRGKSRCQPSTKT